MNMTWITVKKAAELLSCCERTIRYKVKRSEIKYKYLSGSTGQGGRKLEILLESLPDQAQKAYYNLNGDSQPVVNTEVTYTTNQRQKGERRAEAVSQFSKYRRQQRQIGNQKETEIMQSFVKQWNSNHPDFTFTAKTLYEWRRKSKSGNPELLVDRRGGYNRGKSSIPPEMLEYFKCLYLQETKPTVTSCYEHTCWEANQRGILIPGKRAFELAAKNIPASEIAYYREGEKYFTDNFMPYIERDYKTLSPNDEWVSDHHLWDVFVRVPDEKGGWKAIRPWGTYWMDMRTRKIMASLLYHGNPNADRVLSCFSLGAEQYGIPRKVLLDNGKDYKAFDLFNKEKAVEVNGKVGNSLATNLDIQPIYAIPYNAKAKPIERVFNTFESQFGKLQPTYAGSNAKKRPESLNKKDIMEYPTLEEFIQLHDRYVYEIYNEKPHTGTDMNGKSPNKAYLELPFRKRLTNPTTLYFCLMRVKGVRIVQRNGVTFNGEHYYNNNTVQYIGKKVYARYNPGKPDILYIFDEHQNYLFQAQKIQKQGFSSDTVDYKGANAHRRIARHNALDNYIPDKNLRTVSGVQSLIGIQASAYPKTPVPKTDVTELIHSPAMEQAAKRASFSDIERQYQDNLKKQAEEKAAWELTNKRNAEAFKQLCAERCQSRRKTAI